jgi:aspartyl-tRNA(Asn)/glutamyl-tRNA(Gln) amidotransferase subunit C
MITRDQLKNLAELARIELTPDEEEKLLQDLESILGYVQQLNEVPTDGVAPMTGGTALANVLRSDDSTDMAIDGTAARHAFPDERDELLKVPPVFE